MKCSVQTCNKKSHAKTILRNDYWCKGLGMSQPKSEAYGKYLALKGKIRTKSRARKWGE